MNEVADLRVMFGTSRGRVYLLWAVIVLVGYVATHYYQQKEINFVWTVLSVIGFIYMFRVMPMKIKQMKHIFSSWLVPIFLGLVISVLAVRTDLFPDLVFDLGPFWLVVMAVGYFWNGLVDRPAAWYFVVGVINLISAVIIYNSDELILIQYLLSALIATWSMLMLWVFRADA